MLKKAINASLRLNHFKSFEIHDVIYDPISLLDVNMAKPSEFVRGKEYGQVEVLLPLRVSYIENNHFRVETNSFLKLGEIIEVDTHPLVHIMESKKLYVKEFNDTNLYFNKRFSYDLEFIYIDNDFFSSSNENWLIYKELKKDETKIKSFKKFEQMELLEDMARRKAKFKPIRDNIESWVNGHSKKTVPKKLKVMIFDSSLEVFNQIEGRVEDFHYSLNLQTIVVGEAYQVKRSMPHLIVYNYSEENNTDGLKDITKMIKSIEGYHPPIIIFNFKGNQSGILSEVDYINLLISSNDIDLDEIFKMAQILDNKLDISDGLAKVFPKSSDENSLIFYKSKVDIISITESTVYFKSEADIPMWTVFYVEHPLQMLLTVVPHRDGGDLSSEENIYRSLINGVTEIGKSEIRKLINASLKPGLDE